MPSNDDIPGPVCRIRSLLPRDPAAFEAVFTAQGWHKPASQFMRYLELQSTGERDILVAVHPSDALIGYLTIQWQSNYAPFRAAKIPEIVDFNVLKRFQRQGYGSVLMDEAENRITAVSTFAGIGVGLHADYGAAQILYVKRGYVPDGRGIMQDSKFLTYGDQAEVNDDLVLHLTKRLR